MDRSSHWRSRSASSPTGCKGTGLGLTFAKLIARAHENRGRRGELRLANDGGALFSLLLP